MYFKSNNPALIYTPVSSSVRWGVGKPLDAGTLQILENNVSTYQSQNNRTLATQTGGISNIFYLNSTDAEKRGFGQTSYPVPVNFASEALNKQLAWGSDVAMCFGPFYLPTTSTGIARAEYLPINVAFEISGSTTSTVYVAVNNGENPFENEPYSIQSANFTAGEGFYKFSVTGVLEKPAIEENILYQSGSIIVSEQLSPLYVWVGLYRENNTVNFKTLTISNPRLEI